MSNELLEQLDKHKCWSIKYLLNNCFELYQQLTVITRNCPENTSPRARILLLKAGYSEPPLCPICKVNPVKWYQTHWNTYCSSKCGNVHTHQDIERKISIQTTRVKTNIKNLGVENPSQLEEIKERKKATCIKRYGVSHQLQLIEIKERKKATCIKRYGDTLPCNSKESFDKTQETNLVRYGVKFPLQSKAIQQKRNATIRSRYGVAHIMQVEEIRKKTLGFRGSNYTKEIVDKLTNQEFWLEEYNKKKKTISQIAIELGINASNAAHYFYRYSGLDLQSNGSSSAEEKSLKDFISNLAENVITNIFFKKLATLRSHSTLLPRKSIDIYIPELKLAFEYNGIYWHSDTEYSSPNYHLEKTLECERLGIQLIHIWSDDWMFKRSLMERKIKAILGQEKEKIFARKCKIVVPTSEQKRQFYNGNHIKGDGAGSISYALSHDNQLVAMITFKRMKNGVFDLNRFATSCSVPGGFSRLLEYFKRSNDWKKIYTFADKAWSRGDVYLKNGFTKVSETPPAFYGVEGKRVNRLHYTLPRLHVRFPQFKDQNLTQLEILQRVGIRTLWDCGQYRFEVTKHNGLSSLGIETR